MKSTPITSQQYLWDKLDKHTVTDPLEDILKQIEKQTPINHTYTHEQLRNTKNGTHMSATQQESMTTNPRDNISQTNRRVNNGQKYSVNSLPLNKKLRGLVRKVMLTLEPDMEE